MTSRPDFGPDYGQEPWEAPAPAPEELEEERRELFEGERELYEREAGERQVHYPGLEDNELHVQGQVCKRCGSPITATQESRRLLGGHWVHEICPVHHQARTAAGGPQFTVQRLRRGAARPARIRRAGR